MNLHPLSSAPAKRRRYSLPILRSIAMVAGLGGLTTAGRSAEPAPPASAAPGLSDVVLARAALSALDGEAELRGVNLVVSVVDGVAVIGGPVPSTAIAKRAERVVRAVEGMKEVRNTCFVSSGPDPLLKAVAAKSGSNLPPRPVMGELPGVLSGPAPVSPFPPNTLVAAGDSNSTVVARKPALGNGSTMNVLGAPVGPATTAAPPVPPSTAPGTLTSATAGGVLAAANEVKKSEPRFTNLTVDLQGGVLVIGGTAPKAADAWDYAQKLRQMPGVSRVAVGAVAGR
jgi:BON domain-containing protein